MSVTENPPLLSESLGLMWDQLAKNLVDTDNQEVPKMELRIEMPKVKQSVKDKVEKAELAKIQKKQTDFESYKLDQEKIQTNKKLELLEMEKLKRAETEKQKKHIQLEMEKVEKKRRETEKTKRKQEKLDVERFDQNMSAVMLQLQASPKQLRKHVQPGEALRQTLEKIKAYAESEKRLNTKPNADNDVLITGMNCKDPVEEIVKEVVIKHGPLQDVWVDGKDVQNLKEIVHFLTLIKMRIAEESRYKDVLLILCNCRDDLISQFFKSGFVATTLSEQKKQIFPIVLQSCDDYRDQFPWLKTRIHFSNTGSTDFLNSNLKNHLNNGNNSYESSSTLPISYNETKSIPTRILSPVEKDKCDLNGARTVRSKLGQAPSPPTYSTSEFQAELNKHLETRQNHRNDSSTSLIMVPVANPKLLETNTKIQNGKTQTVIAHETEQRRGFFGTIFGCMQTALSQCGDCCFY